MVNRFLDRKYLVTLFVVMSTIYALVFKYLKSLKSGYAISSFGVLVLVISLALSTPAYSAKTSIWLRGTICGALLSSAIYIAPTAVDQGFDVPSIVNRYHDLKSRISFHAEGSVLGFISAGISPIITGPTISVMNALKLRMVGLNRPDSLLAVIGDVGLYTTIVFGSKGIQRLFFAVPHETFLAKSDRELGGDPKSVLFIDFIGPKDRLSGYPEATFNRSYSEHPDAHFVRFESVDQLNRKLKEFKGKIFDRIEVMVHGHPGYVMANGSDGARVPGEDLVKVFSSLGFPLSGPQTQLRLISCSLLNGQGVGNILDQRLKDFVLAILPQGGKVAGAAKNILTFEMAPDPVSYGQGRSQWLDSGSVFLSYMLNAEVARTVLSSVTSLNRNYIDSLNDVVVFKVDESGKIERISN